MNLMDLKLQAGSSVRRRLGTRRLTFLHPKLGMMSMRPAMLMTQSTDWDLTSL
jgi:hypothetical protein